MKLKFRTQLLVPNLIALSLMLIIAIVVFMNVNALLKNSESVEHTYQVIDEGDELLMHMVDQETGMRGFAVTGNDDFLDPYNEGLDHFATGMSALQIKVNDNPVQVARLKDIEKEAAGWDKEVATVYIDLRRSIKNGEDERAKLFELIESGVGKRNMDNLRNLVASSGLSNEVQSQIILDMVNMETGLRGFLLNNKEEFLEPYNDGKSQLDNHFAASQVRQSIQNAAHAWVNDYAEEAIKINKEAMKTSTMDELYAEFAQKKRQDVYGYHPQRSCNFY